MTIETEIQIREPQLKDGKAINMLLQIIPNLDRNSEYLYLLLCTHFSTTCRIALKGPQVIGLCTAYFIPNQEGHLFIWQIGVHPDHTKQGVAGKLLDSLIEGVLLKVTHIHATISPDNAPSRKLFKTFADRRQLECSWSPFLLETHFIGNHDNEDLLTISLLKEEEQ